MLAPMIKETPAAIEKNATREEKSRMVGKEVKSTLQHKPDPTTCSLLFAIIRWPVPKKSAPSSRKGRLGYFLEDHTLLMHTLASPCPNEAMRLNAPSLKSMMRLP